MPRNALFLAFFCLLLSGCMPSNGPAPTLTALPASTIAPTATFPPASVTPTPRPLSASATTTLSPTETITPLPTIPTFTPTFDAQTIVTATLAPKAECPKEDPAIEIDIETLDPLGDVWANFLLAQQRGSFILDLLNKGLKMSLLVAELKEKQFEYYYMDFTGDGVKDVLLNDLHRFHIFYCERGAYSLFTEDRFFDPYWVPKIKITDLNRNGLPEIVARDLVTGLLGQLIYIIDEWNGEKFVVLTQDPESEVSISIVFPKKPEIEFRDVNQDGLTELFFTGHGAFLEDRQARDRTIVYSWNGKSYVYNVDYSGLANPQYRFQAVQDADIEVFYGHYQKAFSFYQNAIFSHTLEWWSPELVRYKHNVSVSQYAPTPTVYPTPAPDLSEYPRLAAYAYYRMVILHTFLGEMDAAQVKYDTLQKKFPADSPGYPYVEMATAFWDTHQSSGKMYNACAAAIAYADAHPEILTPLGDGYHGFQSLDYVPADVCPFR